jgi:hypothetical protein
VYNTHIIHVQYVLKVHSKFNNFLFSWSFFIFLKICGFFISWGFILNFVALWILWEGLFVDMVKREGKKTQKFLSYVVLCACLKSENGCRKLQQSLLIGLFKTITRKEWKEVLQREVEEFYNENGNQDHSILPKNVKKRPIGHPKKFVVTLQFEI